MSAVTRLIDALHGHGIRATGRGSWRARCPVCGVGSTNTLHVTEQADGALLLHCFKSQCSVEDVTSAVGLEPADLFPPRDSHGPKGKRRRLLTDREAIDKLDEEMHIAVVVIGDVLRGVEVSAGDFARLIKAAANVSFLRQEARS